MTTATKSLDRFYSIIPAGGIGSRLWPLSRADAPKFLHDLTGSGSTLLRGTWDRLAPINGEQRIMVVTGRSHRAAVEEQLPALADHNVVLESEPKDSTAAIGLAAAILAKREPDVIIGSFAADHVIADQRAFVRAVHEAIAAADAGYIATIGITPTEPAVGFGYIHCDGGPRHRRRPAREGRHLVRREARAGDRRGVPRATATTSGTPACSSRAPTCCSSRSARPGPSCSPAC